MIVSFPHTEVTLEMIERNGYWIVQSAEEPIFQVFEEPQSAREFFSYQSELLALEDNLY